MVDVPAGHPRSVEWVVAEAEAALASRFTEVHYDEAGRRREPVLRLQPLINDGARVPLGPGDVLLVTGGGKGIAAECGLSLARETGVRLALLGRSHVADDRDLAANLERMAASGVGFRYLAADVTDADAVRAAVKAAESALGPITAVVHGAGVNVPRLLDSLDESAFLQTLAPKVKGCRQHPRGRSGGPAQAASDVRLDHRPDRVARRGRLWAGQRVADAANRAVPEGPSVLSLPRPGVVGLVGRRHGGPAGPGRCPGEARDHADSD